MVVMVSGTLSRMNVAGVRLKFLPVHRRLLSDFVIEGGEVFDDGCGVRNTRGGG